MADTSSGRFTCPTCGKKFKWTSAIAGRKVLCKCGQKMRTPASPGGKAQAIAAPTKADAGGSMYELDVDQEHEHKFNAHEQAMAPKDGKCPSCNQPIKVTAVICINCGFNLKEGKTLTTEVESTKRSLFGAKQNNPRGAMASIGATSAVARAVEARADDQVGSRLFDIYLPLVFIVGGIALIGGLSVWVTADWLAAAVLAGLLLAVQIVITIPLLMLAIVVAAKFTGTTFGPLFQALFKLSSIAIGPGIIADSIYLIVAPYFAFGIFGVFSQLFVLFILYVIFMGAPMAKMFDLDFQEVTTTIMCVIVVKIVAGCVISTWVIASLF